MRRLGLLGSALVLLLSQAIQASVAEEGSPILAGNPVSVPFTWVGLWLFPKADGYHQCTAQFITPRIILMAAHCVRDQDTGAYYDAQNSNSAFLLQFQNESFSKLYHPVCKFVFNDWVVPLQQGEDPSKADTMSADRRKAYFQARSNAWQFDFAMVYLDADSITGHFKVHINERWDGAMSIGYPTAMMGGSIVQRVEGDIFPEANVSFSLGAIPNEQVLWHGNRDYTQGASGGAWVANFNREDGPNKNIIVGLNSFVNPSKPGAMFGPVFNSNFTDLLKFTQDHCRPQ